MHSTVQYEMKQQTSTGSSCYLFSHKLPSSPSPTLVCLAPQRVEA